MKRFLNNCFLKKSYQKTVVQKSYQKTIVQKSLHIRKAYIMLFKLSFKKNRGLSPYPAEALRDFPGSCPKWHNFQVSRQK